MSIEDGGNTLHISGNSWKKVSFSYTVTANTVLEFDFMSTTQGEVHGIGFDNNETMSSGYTHKLYGTQGWGISVPFYKYNTFASDWRHYQIRVGEWYTGNMAYLVFVNDHDIANPTAHSYFRNVRVFEEDPNTPISPPVTVDFDNYVITPYDGSSQSPQLNLTLAENGNSLNMNGNGWLKMSFPYEVTESTVIEFDFKSSNQGQIHGIGFDDNNSQQSDRTFKLYGSQNWGLNAFGYSLYQPEWKHYRIPVGKYYTGMMKYMFFVNDHDGTNPPTAESIFKNLQVYEGEVALPLTIDFNQYALSTYYSPQSGGNSPVINILDNGTTLHLSGNGWTQISLPVDIASNTILEFDFMSTSQGEVHAIGFDTNQNADTVHTLKLYGTQNYGNTVFNNYADSAPEWKHYIVQLGAYYPGQHLYLFFANDHDITNPTGNSYFSNVHVYNSTTNWGGEGTCWESNSTWPNYQVPYTIDRNTIPESFGWDNSIHEAAQTWSSVSPSEFEFYYSENSNNVIYYKVPLNPFSAAESYPHHLFTFDYVIEKNIDINPIYPWDINNVPDPNNTDSNGSFSYNLQNALTHEFGHWLQLEHPDSESCVNTTMYELVSLGEIKKITLEAPDIQAINWQYP
jgi:hypothetical protein